MPAGTCVKPNARKYALVKRPRLAGSSASSRVSSGEMTAFADRYRYDITYASAKATAALNRLPSALRAAEPAGARNGRARSCAPVPGTTALQRPSRAEREVDRA